MFFKQRKARLHCGVTVKEGDLIEFINSDGEICRDTVKRDRYKRLYFWNVTASIGDYKNAIKVSR